VTHRNLPLISAQAAFYALELELLVFWIQKKFAVQPDDFSIRHRRRNDLFGCNFCAFCGKK